MLLRRSSKQECWNRLKEHGRIGEWEQDAIKNTLKTSFINTGTIDRAFKLVGFDRLVYDRKELDDYFRIRHLIVHRSGRQRDDEEVVVTYDMLAELINVCHKLVGAIFDSVCITLDREYKNRPQERDIEEIFPGGVVDIDFTVPGNGSVSNIDLHGLVIISIASEPKHPLVLVTNSSTSGITITELNSTWWANYLTFTYNTGSTFTVSCSRATGFHLQVRYV